LPIHSASVAAASRVSLKVILIGLLSASARIPSISVADFITSSRKTRNGGVS
jgi:hypothetical protein